MLNNVVKTLKIFTLASKHAVEVGPKTTLAGCCSAKRWKSHERATLTPEEPVRSHAANFSWLCGSINLGCIGVIRSLIPSQ